MKGFIKIECTPESDTGTLISCEVELERVSRFDKMKLLQAFLSGLNMTYEEASVTLFAIKAGILKGPNTADAAEEAEQ